ncbi:MAG: radical SAM family heme chaperone HemW [Armatimonadota bacterium]|nr:radical SAM family heme chaperone HemW [Armatimonadota bacterium]
MQVGLYVHVPFCARKCPYCDFYSLPLGERRLVDAYVAAVCQEMEAVAKSYTCLGRLEAPTLYLGGGTPSLLDLEDLQRLLEGARKFFHLLPDAEVTVECNPGSVDAAKAQGLRRLGVNRVTLGVQSFDDQLLRVLERAHTAADALQAMTHLRAAGFDNIGIDVIFGIPGETLADWCNDLRRAVALRPQHLSAYGLTIEEGTPFAQWVREGRLQRVDDDLEADMFEAAMAAFTAAGYEHYEISNYALPGKRSRHNQIYWRNEPYLGFGPSAVSYIDGVRWGNIASLPRYLAAMEHGTPPIEWSERAPRPLQMGETMMAGLRLLEGVEYARFRSRFGVTPAEAYPHVLQRLAETGLLSVGPDRVALTHRGLLLANNVMAEFLPD